MHRVVVDVMLKPEILDPQGRAVADALPGLGFTGVRDLRVGRHIEIEFDEGVGGADGVDEALLAQVREMAERLLANPVIEDFVVRAADGPLAVHDAPVES